jgi:hypothetical protein
MSYIYPTARSSDMQLKNDTIRYGAIACCFTGRSSV